MKKIFNLASLWILMINTYQCR